MAVHLASALAWLSMLAMLTVFSWTIVRSPDPALRPAMRRVRRRLLAPLWTAIGLLIVTGVYNQYRNVPFPLPHPWQVQDITIPYGKAYVFLLLGKHIFVAQMVAALAVVTWRLAGASTVQAAAPVVAAIGARATVAVGAPSGGRGPGVIRRDNGSLPADAQFAPLPSEQTFELGTALVGTLALVSGVLVLLIAAALGYVHILAHGHGA